MNAYDPAKTDSPELSFGPACFQLRSVKRAVDFMMEENVCLKNRVAEILKNGFDTRMLAMLEVFQDSFISHDQLIELLRNDVARMEQLIQEAVADSTAFAAMCHQLKRLQKSITAAEDRFKKMKAAFNDTML